MNFSSAYERFCWSVFDKSMGAERDGVDFQALNELSSNEKNDAEGRILEALSETDDSRPFIAAGAMKLPAAAPIIKQRIASGFRKNIADYMTVHAAHALFLIEQWPDASAVIIKILQNTPKTAARQWTRMTAAYALADFSGDYSVAATLFATVEDEDDFIGFLAIKSLKKLYKQDRAVFSLLEKLQETQVEPNRKKPEYIRQRQELFLELKKITGMTMPDVQLNHAGRNF